MFTANSVGSCKKKKSVSILLMGPWHIGSPNHYCRPDQHPNIVYTNIQRRFGSRACSNAQLSECPFIQILIHIFYKIYICLSDCPIILTPDVCHLNSFSSAFYYEKKNVTKFKCYTHIWTLKWASHKMAIPEYMEDCV